MRPGLHMHHFCDPDLATVTARVAQIVIQQVGLGDGSHIAGDANGQGRCEPWVAYLVQIPQVHAGVDDLVLHDSPPPVSKWFARPKYRKSPRSRRSIPRSPANTPGPRLPPLRPGAPWESSTSCSRSDSGAVARESGS